MVYSKKKSFVFVLVLLVAFSLVLTACGDKVSTDTQTPAGSTEQKQEVLRVGIDNTYPPMEYQENGENVGFDIDFANEIGKKLNMKVEFVPTAWSGVFLSLDANKYDCIISSLSITAERQEKYAMTKPYIANSQVIVVKSDNSDITGIPALKDKTVGVQLGTTSEEACNEAIKTTPFELKTYDAMTDALLALRTGKVDAVVCDLVIGKYFVNKDANKIFKTVEAGLPSEPIGIGFTKKNEELMKEVDQVIADFQKDGTLATISKKWFGDDMTSNIK
jgi:polar amino acid transport system substrate-binding protein